MRNKDRYERAFGSVLLVYEREGGRGGGGGGGGGRGGFGQGGSGSWSWDLAK